MVALDVNMGKRTHTHKHTQPLICCVTACVNTGGVSYARNAHSDEVIWPHDMMLCDETYSRCKLGKLGKIRWAKQRTVLFVQDESVDLRQIYLSVAALSGSVSFKSLLHCAFNVSPIGPFATSGVQNNLFLLLSDTEDMLSDHPCSCSTRKAKAVWVQESCLASWVRWWVFLSGTSQNFTLRHQTMGTLLKVSRNDLWLKWPFLESVLVKWHACFSTPDLPSLQKCE